MRYAVIYAVVVIGLLAISLLVPSKAEHESIRTVMREAVLHETQHIALWGILSVNPALIASSIVTIAILLVALCVRIFVIPHFTMMPGKLQLLLEQWVLFFDGMARTNSPHRNRFLGAYIFGAGTYIFVGTLFELFGVQATTTSGTIVALPAPLSDINGAIALGVLSYLVIMSGGIAGNGIRGVGMTLKDFSLPISMSFRLFGALLSGLLVTELVYYNVRLSIGLPVVVAVMFTLLHALIQTYVLGMLTALFYGEVCEPHQKKKKSKAEQAQPASVQG